MKKLVCLILAVAVGVSGCGSLKRAAPDEGNKAVNQIDQAASLHTSITSIAPWEDIKDKLKPGFALSANDALTKSIPTTLVRLDRVLDLLRVQLALTPSITKQSSTTTTSSGTGKDPATTSDSKTERSSPDLPTMAPPTGLSASAPATLAAPDAPADALLQYQTAANLLRDIAVLNSEVDNVSRRTGQDAFLTRIQVSVMPLRHGLGYDVYANLSMFGSTGSFDPRTGERTEGELLPAVPLVIPILSTDSVQATRRSTNSTAQREVGLALNLLQGFGSVGASLGRNQGNENDAAGNDLESVVTVGRLSDNTIRIRMGADPLPGGGYGMVARTFNISAVVFLPKDAKQLYYVSRLSLHHVLDGTELSTTRTPSYEEGITRISQSNHRDFPGLTPDILTNHLDDYAFHGDFKSFAKQLTPLAAEGTNPLELQREAMYVWSELIALNRQTRFANSVVDVPRPPAIEWPPADQLVAYTSDAKGVTVSLGLGKNMRADAIDARLILGPCPTPKPVAAPRAVPAASTPKSAKKPAAKTEAAPTPPCQPASSPASVIQASSVTPSKDGRAIALQFPPVDQIQGLSSSATKLAPYSVALRNYPGASAAPAPPPYVFVAAIPAKPDAADKSGDTAASLVPESRVIVADKDRKGRIAFVVQGGDKTDLKVLVHASVVSFADDAGKAVTHKGTAWDVADAVRYVLSLENLSESAVVQIELVSQPDKAKKSASLFSTEIRVEETHKK